MKKILINLLMLLSFTVGAEPLKFTFNGGVFGASYSDESNHIVDYNLKKHGVIFSADSNKFFGVDMMLSDRGISGGLKLSLDVSSFKVSVGAGVEAVDYSVTDNTDSWNYATVGSKSNLVGKFIDVAHSSGVFLLYTEMDHDTSVEFIRSHYDAVVGGHVIDNQKTVSINKKIAGYMLGYKVAF